MAALREAVRYFDAILNSAVFWGVLSLTLLLFGSGMQGVVRVVAFVLAWLAGSYKFYSWWSVKTAQDWRLIVSLLLCYTGALLLLYFWTDPLRPVSRPISGEPVGYGIPVASVSLLNVGASPNQGPITNPPGWVAPRSAVQLIFQDSPLLTDEVKNQVREDVSAFREYLLRLGIPVPDEFPPIGVGKGPESSQTHVFPSLPSYRSKATISRKWFVDRRAVTKQYAHYAIDEVLRRRALYPRGGILQDMIAASASSQYYNWSFWDYKPIQEGGYWSSQLWEIRSSFGKEFTDRLLGFAIKSMLDSPEEGADANFDVYFYHKLQQGDSVIDSNPERMSKITEIIENSGINVTAPRAYFDFSAAAVKRRDGSYVINVMAVNKSGVPASHGQFQIHFAPDVQILVGPKGSMKDPRTTLRSARLIPFDYISAHTASNVKFEFKPIAKSFADLKFFVIHFDYHCATCADDKYSHDLKFRLNLFDVKG